MSRRVATALATLLKQRSTSTASTQGVSLRHLSSLRASAHASSTPAEAPEPANGTSFSSWAVVASTAGSIALFGTLTSQNISLADAEPQSKVEVTPELPVDGKKKKKGPPADRYDRPKQLKGLPKEVILYQYEVCPFCCKVKAVLDFYKIPYRVVEVSPLFKTELKWSGHDHVPVVVLDGEVMLDSSLIISRVAAEAQADAAGKAAELAQSKGWLRKGGNSAATLPAEPSAESSAEELKWRSWVDEWLVRVITINIYSTGKESFQTFEYITEHGNFNWFEREAARYVGAAMMWGLSGRLKKKYKIEGEPRAELYACINQWVDALGERRFMGGDVPNLADLSTFGAIRSVNGTDTFMDLMHTTDVGKWYEQMMAVVGPTSRIS